MQELVILTTAPPWKRKEEKCMWGAWWPTEMSAAQRCPALPGRLNLADRLPCDRKGEIARQRSFPARVQRVPRRVFQVCALSYGQGRCIALQIFRRVRSLRSGCGCDKRHLHAHIPRRRAAAHDDCRNITRFKL